MCDNFSIYYIHQTIYLSDLWGFVSKTKRSFLVPSTYHKFPSTSPCCFEADAGLFRLLMKGILDAYVLRLFRKGFIFESVSVIRTRDSTINLIQPNVESYHHTTLSLFKIRGQCWSHSKNITLFSWGGWGKVQIALSLARIR